MGHRSPDVEATSFNADTLKHNLARCNHVARILRKINKNKFSPLTEIKINLKCRNYL